VSVQMADSPNAEKPNERLKTKVSLVVGILVVLLAIWSLYSLYRPPDGARDFTRVGGSTRVETSIEAAHFWSKPGPIVLAPTRASPENMLNAGLLAARLDAPLLLVGKTLRKSMQRELLRLRQQPQRERLCFVYAEPSLKRAIPERLRTEMRPCPGLNDEPTQSMSPIHLVAPNNDFLPSRTSNHLVSHPAESSSGCDLPSKLLELLGRWLSTTSDPGANLRCDLPHTVVFATAQDHSDLPDVAVAIALAAHLEKAAAVDQAVVVMLPRYLESAHGLETFLHQQGTKVARGVVIGESGAVSNELRTSLRSVTTLTDLGAIVQGSSTLLEKLGVLIGLLLTLGILGAGAGAVAGAAAGTAAQVVSGGLTDQRKGEGPVNILRPGGGERRTPSSKARDGVDGPAEKADAQKADTEKLDAQEGGRSALASAEAALRAVVNKYRTDQDIWVRLRLRNPETWVAGKLEDTTEGTLLTSPFPDSDALWLVSVVQCDPSTGDFRIPHESGPRGADEPPSPLRRASALAVRWQDIQLLEVISRDGASQR
jgi:hypothetical protein